MTILIAGASGATGQHLVHLLLNQGHKVKAIVRSPERFPGHLKDHKDLELIKASILDMRDDKLSQDLKGCDAVASCLGHNLTFKGVFGSPRRLVRDSVMKLCRTIQDIKPRKPIRFVLMNTSGNQNRDLRESVSATQKIVVSMIRLLIPPHADNEEAADFLRTEVGQNHHEVEWVAVRPDGLIDEDEVSAYDVHPSPVRSAIFNPGKTSRINVAHFMTKLITDDSTWKRWKGQMPVIYNQAYQV